MLTPNKRALIMGVANERSIAWAAAQRLKLQGAEIILTYPNDAIKKRVEPLAAELGAKAVIECDVSSDASITRCFEQIKKHWDHIDILVHSLAFADKQDLEGAFVTTSRESFRKALDVSAYSLIAVTREALPLMKSGSSIITMTYLGATKVIQNYNLMGVAKAALEACVRYLAWDLGSKGIRVNAISAGPVKTLAASGVRGFRSLLDSVGQMSALQRNITADEVGKSTVYLASDLSSGVTGEIHFVDAGFNTGALRVPDAKPQAD
ncbi:MAG: enoyl-ACP reductase [Oligoflexia bacterium]|nr:enoyl-ACP reductase [Oligoflexia bacterium]